MPKKKVSSRKDRTKTRRDNEDRVGKRRDTGRDRNRSRFAESGLRRAEAGPVPTPDTRNLAQASQPRDPIQHEQVLRERLLARQEQVLRERLLARKEQVLREGLLARQEQILREEELRATLLARVQAEKPVKREEQIPFFEREFTHQADGDEEAFAAFISTWEGIQARKTIALNPDQIRSYVQAILQRRQELIPDLDDRILNRNLMSGFEAYGAVIERRQRREAREKEGEERRRKRGAEAQAGERLRNQAERDFRDARRIILGRSALKHTRDGTPGLNRVRSKNDLIRMIEDILQHRRPYERSTIKTYSGRLGEGYQLFYGGTNKSLSIIFTIEQRGDIVIKHAGPGGGYE